VSSKERAKTTTTAAASLRQRPPSAARRAHTQTLTNTHAHTRREAMRRCRCAPAPRAVRLSCRDRPHRTGTGGHGACHLFGASCIHHRLTEHEPSRSHPIINETTRPAHRIRTVSMPETCTRRCTLDGSLPHRDASARALRCLRAAVQCASPQAPGSHLRSPPAVPVHKAECPPRTRRYTSTTAISANVLCDRVHTLLQRTWRIKRFPCGHGSTAARNQRTPRVCFDAN
jgi:hypothetical protein